MKFAFLGYHVENHWAAMSDSEQEAMIEDAPGVFFRPPYVGPAGWIGVEMAGIDDDWLGSLIREAFQLTTAKDRRAGPRKSSKSRPIV